MSKKKPVDERRFSRLVVDGAKQSPSRAMLRAVGFQDADSRSRKSASRPPGPA
jgi:hypothetical protein